MSPALHAWALRADHVLRAALPTAIAACFTMLSVVPWPIPGAGPVAPDLLLIAVWFWAVYRPRALPNAAILVLGVVEDVLTAGPLGLQALILLLVRGIVPAVTAGRRPPGTGVAWAGFIVTAVAAAAVGWAVASAYFLVMLWPMPAVAQVLATIVLYVPVTAMLGLVLRRLPEPR